MEINLPKPFNPNKNQVAKDWLIWKKEFITYLRLSNGYELLSEEKRALLLQNLMGTKAVEAMEEMNFDNPSDKDDMDILLAKFDEVFDPPSNEVEDRYKFFSRMKGENETIEKYIMDLKEKAKKCKFGNQTEKFIIDMIILNMDTHLRQIILKEEDIHLDNIIHSYKQNAINVEKIKELSQNIAKDLNSGRKDGPSNVPSGSKEKPRNCWKCNTLHRPRMCPANGNICNVCNERNHLDGLCQKGSKSNNQDKIKPACSKCGTNHPYKQCPAFHNTCYKCNQKGHSPAQCEKLNASKSTTNKKNNEGSSFNLPPEAPPSYFQATTNYSTEPPKPTLSNPPGASNYCYSCRNIQGVFCYDCKLHTKSAQENERKNNFVKVEHSHVPYRTKNFQSRGPTYNHPKNKPKKKDDPCSIS